MRNQGDAWTWTLDQFNRALDDIATPRGGSARHRGDDIARLSRDRRRDRPAARRDACRAGAADRTIRPSRPRRATRARRRRLDRARDRRCSTRAFDACSRRKRAGRTRPSKPRRSALLAQQRSADARAAASWRQGGRRHCDDPHPRRLPSRPGAGRQRRRLHHRLRGRAGAPARRAPRARRARCAMSPGCCARSTMRPPRRSIRRARSPAAGRRTSSAIGFVTRLRDGAKQAFLGCLSREP